jgi:hypothetical protein
MDRHDIAAPMTRLILALAAGLFLGSLGAKLICNARAAQAEWGDMQ